MVEKTQDQARVDRVVNEALDADIPQLYFNGYTNVIGQGDALMVLQRNGRAVATVSMSYTVCKSLANSLRQLVERLEAATGNEIMTTDQVHAAMESGKGENDEPT